MPLVRIDLVEGRSDEALKTILDTIQDCVKEAFETPDRDRYQLMTQHKANEIVFLDTGLGFERTSELIVVQVFTSPRTPPMKQRFYKLMAKKLHDSCGLEGKDLFISIFSNGPDDWTFGFGEAQYLTGIL